MAFPQMPEAGSSGFSEQTRSILSVSRPQSRADDQQRSRPKIGNIEDRRRSSIPGAFEVDDDEESEEGSTSVELAQYANSDNNRKLFNEKVEEKVRRRVEEETKLNYDTIFQATSQRIAEEDENRGHVSQPSQLQTPFSGDRGKGKQPQARGRSNQSSRREDDPTEYYRPFSRPPGGGGGPPDDDPSDNGRNGPFSPSPRDRGNRRNNAEIPSYIPASRGLEWLSYRCLGNTMANKLSDVKLEPLKGQENFRSWKIDMKILLERDDVLPVATGEVESPNRAIHREEWVTWQFCDRASRSHLIGGVSSHLKEDIADIPTAAQIWKDLEYKYEVSTAVRSSQAVKSLGQHYLQNCSGIQEYFTKMRSIIRDIESNRHGSESNDWLYAEFAIANLDESWNTWVTSFMGRMADSKGQNQFKFEQIYAELLDEEKRRKDCTIGVNTVNTKKGKSKSSNKPRCNYCKKGPHQEKNCWLKYPEKRPQKDNSNKNAETVNKDEEKVGLSMDVVYLTLAQLLYR